MFTLATPANASSSVPERRAPTRRSGIAALPSAGGGGAGLVGEVSPARGGGGILAGVVRERPIAASVPEAECVLLPRLSEEQIGVQMRDTRLDVDVGNDEVPDVVRKR